MVGCVLRQFLFQADHRHRGFEELAVPAVVFGGWEWGLRGLTGPSHGKPVVSCYDVMLGMEWEWGRSGKRTGRISEGNGHQPGFLKPADRARRKNKDTL